MATATLGSCENLVGRRDLERVHASTGRGRAVERGGRSPRRSAFTSLGAASRAPQPSEKESSPVSTASPLQKVNLNA